MHSRLTLPAYRKELIRRDLEQGLDICLFGALSGELTPGIWTEQLADDDLWNAMTACDPMRDPFSLLGALDIALGRQHDQRYRDFAEGAVIKLLDDKFSRPDGNDTYELLPLLAELVLNRINTLEGGALRAPYWKRMCAWMQAAFLSRLTLPFSLDVGELRMWARANMTQAGMYSVMLDLRREPMYRASEMSPSSLREEIASRLILLRSRHEAAGHHMPRSGEIDELIARIARQGSPLGCTLPGPLEGHRRPAETEGRRLPVEVAKDVLEIFAPDLSQWKWANLAYLSQYFEFDEELLLRACDAVRKCDFEAKGEIKGEDIDELIGACLIAAVHRDARLAHAIAEKILSHTENVFTAKEVVSTFRLLLLAGASFENEDEWAKWLEKQLYEVAIRIPRGEASKEFLEHIQEIKRAIKLGGFIHARGEAVALATT